MTGAMKNHHEQMKPTFQVARRQRKLCDKEKTPRPKPGYKDGMERSEKARFHPTYKIMRAIKVSSVVLAAVTHLKSDQKHRIAMELISIGARNRHNHEQSPLKPAA